MGWNPEVDAINDRHDGIIRVGNETAGYREQGQLELVKGFEAALKGESPADQEDGWVMSGSIGNLQTWVYREPNGLELLKVSLQVLSPDVDPDAAFPVLVQRNPEGDLAKVTLDFTRRSTYSTSKPELAEAVIKELRAKLDGLKRALRG